MTHFYTAKAVDGENVVFANHTLDLDDLSFPDPEGELLPSGRFQLPAGTPKEKIEAFLAHEIKNHALRHRDETILLRLADNGEVVFWNMPKTFTC